MTLKEIEAQVSALTGAEKAELLKRLALDLTHTWPGIDKIPMLPEEQPAWHILVYRSGHWKGTAPGLE